MSRKTFLAIVAFVQLFLGAYFVLAFFAWIAKMVLASSFTPEHGKGAAFLPFMLAVWVVLAALSFVLYNRTKRKLKNMEPDSPKEPLSKESRSDAKSEAKATTAA